MGIYTNGQIQTAINDGSIVCVPFRDSQLDPRGLAVHLGSYYYRADQPSPSTTHNPLDPEDLERYFEGPFKALTHARQCSLSGLRPSSGLAAAHPVIILGPGERIVAHVHEFVGTPAPNLARLEELPSWHQSGLVVTPNFTELAAVTRPSVSIQNTNARKHIILPVGAPIARLVFYGASSTVDTATKSAGGHPSTQIDEAISTWTPASMLAQPISGAIELPATIQGLRYE